MIYYLIIISIYLFFTFFLLFFLLFFSPESSKPPSTEPFDDEDFLGLIPQIQNCFENDDPRENLKSLYALKNSWGNSTAQKLELLLKNESECVDYWYQLTRLSKSVNINDVREKELSIMAELGVK